MDTLAHPPFISVINSEQYCSSVCDEYLNIFYKNTGYSNRIIDMYTNEYTWIFENTFYLKQLWVDYSPRTLRWFNYKVK